jgi:hypothetical protein
MSDQPRIAFNGVRSSCETTARNSSFRPAGLLGRRPAPPAHAQAAGAAFFEALHLHDVPALIFETIDEEHVGAIGEIDGREVEDRQPVVSALR